ncbi:MAG: efflux RND transporter permease subunit [Microscillaceae bacterium]
MARIFINSRLTPLLMIAFLSVGIYSALLTPREEEPQIDVPIADIFFRYEGASAEEVKNRIVAPIEKFIANIPGVEYVYSTSMPGQAILIVRFYVGQDVERSYVKLYNEMMKNMDKMPAGVSFPLVKTRSIDDVPMLGLTLWSEQYDDYQLRRMAQELDAEIKKVNEVAQTQVIGGRGRQIRITLDREKMGRFEIDLLSVAQQIEMANQQVGAGSFNEKDTEYLVEIGTFLSNADEVANLVVGVYQDNPIYLKQVARVEEGTETASQYVTFGLGKGNTEENLPKGGDFSAVTISVAKRRGADAMLVSDKILDKIESLRGSLIPSEVQIAETRNYGETASHKVSELMLHLIGSIIAVTIVVALAMGWRGGLVVFLSVPVTFALTLLVYYLFGYTLNRITLFALVFVTGIVVDDSIIIAENMHRHFKMKRLPFFQAALASIDEVGNPTILATFTVISAVLPMAFVSGLMGPYMSPMPIGASFAMLFSLIIALIITPYLAYRLLRHEGKKGHQEEKAFRMEDTGIYKSYRWFMNPLLNSVWKRWTFIGVVTLLLMASMAMLLVRMVEVKMLPFDNKNEFQVIIDMPEGTTLERTAVVTREIAAYLREQPEVRNYQTYVGTAAPMNFNGLVRHYDLRRGSNVADIQVNLTDKGSRSAQSHDIANKFRPMVQQIAARYQANAKVVEVPPGPPVISTLVAEIYGPNAQERIRVAQEVKKVFQNTTGVVDVDWMVEDEQTEYKFEVNKEKAMLAGVSTQQIVQTLHMSLQGRAISRIYQEKEREPVGIFLRLSEADRSGLDELKKIPVRTMAGTMITVGDLVQIREQIQDKSIYRKNQQEVVYVTADVANEVESPVYAILDISQKLKAIKMPQGYSLSELYTTQPFLEEDYSLKWDGEWHITYEVFRDLGAAFAVVLVVIYMLIVGWFQDFKVPVVMMLAIPLSLVGILVGHWMMGAFFTATSMIGMIALAGIMVRNSVLLIDFINLQLEEGVPLHEAVIQAGAVRTMPILLTAGTVVIGAFVILFDPIFQGLAISLMGGSIASTALTLLMVPLIYYMTERRKYASRETAVSPSTATEAHSDEDKQFEAEAEKETA